MSRTTVVGAALLLAACVPSDAQERLETEIRLGYRSQTVSAPTLSQSESGLFWDLRTSIRNLPALGSDSSVNLSYQNVHGSQDTGSHDRQEVRLDAFARLPSATIVLGLGRSRSQDPASAFVPERKLRQANDTLAITVPQDEALPGLSLTYLRSTNAARGLSLTTRTSASSLGLSAVRDYGPFTLSYFRQEHRYTTTSPLAPAVASRVATSNPRLELRQALGDGITLQAEAAQYTTSHRTGPEDRQSFSRTEVATRLDVRPAPSVLVSLDHTQRHDKSAFSGGRHQRRNQRENRVAVRFSPAGWTEVRASHHTRSDRSSDLGTLETVDRQVSVTAYPTDTALVEAQWMMAHTTITEPAGRGQSETALRRVSLSAQQDLNEQLSLRASLLGESLESRFEDASLTTRSTQYGLGLVGQVGSDLYTDVEWRHTLGRSTFSGQSPVRPTANTLDVSLSWQIGPGLSLDVQRTQSSQVTVRGVRSDRWSAGLRAALGPDTDLTVNHSHSRSVESDDPGQPEFSQAERLDSLRLEHRLDDSTRVEVWYAASTVEVPELFRRRDLMAFVVTRF